jgi:hypothetical protein
MTERRQHPDDDLLADLAAQVLPDDVAARVQAHVTGCGRCTDLLADAEGIRVLLRDDDPGPIPQDVAARIEAALSGLRLTGTTGTAAGDDAPHPADGGRVGATQLHARRSRPRPGRVGRGLLAAAAAVAMLGAGGVALRAAELGPFGDSPGTASATSGDTWVTTKQEGGAAAGSGGPSEPAPPVVATRTEYTQAALTGQTRRLVASAQSRSAAPGAAQDDTAEGTGDEGSGSTPTPPVAPSAPPSDLPSGPGADTEADREADTEGRRLTTSPSGDQSLRSPAALRACLSALGAPTAQPVTVDLARYEGRDAAVLVLPGAAGAYDVWVVARDCRPGAVGTLEHVTVTP